MQLQVQMLMLPLLPGILGIMHGVDIDIGAQKLWIVPDVMKYHGKKAITRRACCFILGK